MNHDQNACALGFVCVHTYYGETLLVLNNITCEYTFS